MSAWRNVSENPRSPVLNFQIQKVSEFEAAHAKKVQDLDENEDVPF